MERNAADGEQKWPEVAEGLFYTDFCLLTLPSACCLLKPRTLSHGNSHHFLIVDEVLIIVVWWYLVSDGI
jgi:hypothetical protein